MAQLRKYREHDISDANIGATLMDVIERLAAAIPKFGPTQAFCQRWIQHMMDSKAIGREIDPVYSWRGHIQHYLPEYLKCIRGVRPEQLEAFDRYPWMRVRLAVEVMGAFPLITNYACRVSVHCRQHLEDYWQNLPEEPTYKFVDVSFGLKVERVAVPYIPEGVPYESEMLRMAEEQSVLKHLKFEAERNTTMQTQVNVAMKVSRTELLEKIKEQIAALEGAIKSAEQSLEATVREQALPQLVAQMVKAGSPNPLVGLALPNLVDARQQLSFLREYASALDVGSQSEIEMPTNTVMALLKPYALTMTTVSATWNLSAKVG